MKPRLKPGPEIVGELMAYTPDDLELAGHAVRVQCIAEPRDPPETGFPFAR